jgi:hypothetical protein
MKNWNKPNLAILVRRQPNEVILAACKTLGSGADTVADSGCNYASACEDCHDGA